MNKKRGILLLITLIALLAFMFLYKNVSPGKSRIESTEVMESSCLVSVDYAIPIEDLVRRGGYDHPDNNITTEHFPTKHAGKVEIVIEFLRFNSNITSFFGDAKIISSEDVINEMDKMGLRPAEARELLAFGEKVRDDKRELDIVALGSDWNPWYSHSQVVCIGTTDDAKRIAVLLPPDKDWDDRWWFAAVRK